MLVGRVAAVVAGGGKMSWFWLNIPFMLLFLCCWAGIPLWHTLTRWDAELKAKHAEIAARAIAAPLVASSVPAPAGPREAGRPAYAGAGDQGW